MEDCDYTIEIIIVPLKERIAETNFFFKINIPLLKELVKRWVTAITPVKINTVPFKEWMTAIPSVAKTDILLQGMGSSYKNDETDKLPIKHRMHKIDLRKK